VAENVMDYRTSFQKKHFATCSELRGVCDVIGSYAI
jgi:hypothetical protein